MSPEDGSLEAAPQTCIIQYIIFPPHVTTNTSVDSLSEDDFYTGNYLNLKILKFCVCLFIMPLYLSLYMPFFFPTSPPTLL